VLYAFEVRYVLVEQTQINRKKENLKMMGGRRTKGEAVFSFPSALTTTTISGIGGHAGVGLSGVPLPGTTCVGADRAPTSSSHFPPTPVSPTHVALRRSAWKSAASSREGS
jgi:hypothetical protein